MASARQLIKLALFGKPIKSSLSPSIHRMFADQFGLGISYELKETGAEAFPEALEDFRLGGGTGCNVTLPLKHEAWLLAGRSSKQASQAQAANTLVYEASSGWMAHTTDGEGLVTDLTVNHGIGLAGKRLLILGAGGATASVLGSLMEGGPTSTTLVNRNVARARVLAERFGTDHSISVINWERLQLESGFDLVINATSLGHQGKAPALKKSLFAPGSVCYDLNYYKASEPLKRCCEDMSQPYIDGLGMLVEQAAASFKIWTGKKPDSRAVINAHRSEAN